MKTNHRLFFKIDNAKIKGDSGTDASPYKMGLCFNLLIDSILFVGLDIPRQ